MSYFPSPCDHSNWVKTQPQRRRFYAWLECQQISVDLLSEEWIMHRMPPLRIDSRAGKRRNKGRQDQIARRRPEVSILYHAACWTFLQVNPTTLDVQAGRWRRRGHVNCLAPALVVTSFKKTPQEPPSPCSRKSSHPFCWSERWNKSSQGLNWMQCTDETFYRGGGIE